MNRDVFVGIVFGLGLTVLFLLAGLAGFLLAYLV